MKMKKLAKRTMWKLFALYSEDYLDCGEVNTTSLAENTAWELDHDEWLNEEQHWIWDLAFELSEAVEQNNLSKEMGKVEMGAFLDGDPL